MALQNRWSSVSAIYFNSRCDRRIRGSTPCGDELARGATRLPAAHDHPLLRVESDAFLALDVQGAETAALGAGKRKHGHRRGHADVDADHAGAGAVLELPCRMAASGVDDRAVAEGAAVGQIDGLVERGYAGHAQDR